MKKAEIELLNQQIETELGINLSTYKNPEFAENIIDLLLFPKYVVKSIGQTTLISILIYFLGFNFLNLGSFEKTIYVIFGLVLFLIEGIAGGLLVICLKIKLDLIQILSYILDVLSNILKDSNQLKVSEISGSQLSLLFKGITHIIFIPVLSKAIKNKIPFFGRIISPLLSRGLSFIAQKIDFSEKMKNNALENNKDSKNTFSKYSVVIENVKQNINSYVSIAFKVITLPFLTVFGLISSILLVFLYILNA